MAGAMDDTPASPDIDLNGLPTAEAAAAPPPAAPAVPWEGPSPDVVAWMLVNWHNKHPLARRIGIADVHTVGAVALPFMAQALPKEPSLEGGAPAEAAPTPPKRRLPWQRKAARTGPRPAWVDDFIPGLKRSKVTAMALDHGFTSAPDELPLRRVEIDERALAGGPEQAGAWPMELVLLSAAFDAGPARRRVLVGRRDRVLGQRALDPARLGVAGSVAALVLIVAGWVLWPSSTPSPDQLAAQAAAQAASAASAAQAAEAASAASAALAAQTAASAAPAPASAVATAEAAPPASDAASSPAAPVAGVTAASAPSSAVTAAPVPADEVPNIRPTLQSGVERAQREREQSQAAPPADASRSKAAESGRPGASAPAAEAERRLAVDDAGLTSLMKRGMAPGGKPVALVGLPVKSKADAEAQLGRMREMIAQTLGGAAPPNGDVFQTKEGWRAAVWPFATREEAQLINATLLARGMRARAVDF
jgi:hypothetical protein